MAENLHFLTVQNYYPTRPFPFSSLFFLLNFLKRYLGDSCLGERMRKLPQLVGLPFLALGVPVILRSFAPSCAVVQAGKAQLVTAGCRRNGSQGLLPCVGSNISGETPPRVSVQFYTVFEEYSLMWGVPIVPIVFNKLT